MASDKNVFRRSILDVVGEVLRDLQASMSERELCRLDWLLDVVHINADSLGTIVDLNLPKSNSLSPSRSLRLSLCS